MPADTVDMDRLLELRQAKPFEPFAFQLKDGKRVDVLGALRFATNGTGVVVIPPRGAAERFKLADVLGVRKLTAAELASFLH